MKTRVAAGVSTALALFGCEPKTIEYAVEVRNEFPGTRIGIFRETGGPPLATTTREKETLAVVVGFTERLTARFVDAPDLPGVRLMDAEIDRDDLRTHAKEHRPVPRHLFASLSRRETDRGWIEIVLAAPIEEPLTVGTVTVDTKQVPPGTRLIVPTKPDGTISVKVGASASVDVELGGRTVTPTGPVQPNAFVYVDPTATACLQVRDVFYGNAKLVNAKPGDLTATKRLPPKKLHVFRGKEIPTIIVGEPVPDTVSGMGVGYRSVFERCPVAR